MTRRERLESKLQKREQWAESRRADAFKRFDNAHAATAGIPMGQPILVGHHSEGRHRAALKRSDSNMRAGCESMDMAAHHASKAAGLESQLESSVFSDDPEAIEQLEAKIAEAQAEQERYKATNAIIRRSPKYKTSPDKIAALVALGLSEGLAAKTFEPDVCGSIGIPSYRLSNNNANIRRMKQRIEEIKRRQERASQAEANGGISIRYSTDRQWCSVTFADKPEYDVRAALKAGGFRWGAGCWSGPTKNLPAGLDA